MTKETKDLCLSGLERMRGDDYRRAKAAFRNHTPEQMETIYGFSGKTCQQILDEYSAHDEKVNRAIAEIVSL